jgi:hypothetical protein
MGIGEQAVITLVHLVTKQTVRMFLLIVTKYVNGMIGWLVRLDLYYF